MSKWEPRFPIEYSPRGDDIDTFAQKTKAELELIYNLLNVLRQNSPASGNLRDVEPYQFHVDTSNGKIFIRNAANTAWSVIGNVNEDYFGITARDIGAIENDGTIGKISAGTVKPTDSMTGDMFYSYEERRLYYYTGTSWEIFLSLNFADLYDYERYCVARAEVDYSGSDKTPRLDRNTGKGNFDISGSADKILGYPVETANLKDGQVLMFDNAKQKWVNQPKDAVIQSEISNNGGANKIVETDNNGFAQVSISGSAAAIDGVNVSASNPDDGDTLVYHRATNSFRAEPKGAAGDGKTLTFTKSGNTVAEYNGAKETAIDLTAAAQDFDGTKDLVLNVSDVKKLGTARKLEFTGDVTGSEKFDGSSDVKIALVVNQAKAATTAALATAAVQATQDAKGNVIDTTYATKEELSATQMTVVDKYLGDYAKSENVESEYAKIADIEENYVNRAELAGMTATLTSGSADKLSTARTISLTGAVKGKMVFDGSGNVEMEVEIAESTALTAAELAAIFYF